MIQKFQIDLIGQEAIVVVIVWYFDLLLHMQSFPITTNVVSSNPNLARCTRYNIMW
jgi:hypothetical protein